MCYFMSDWYQCRIIISNSDFPFPQYKNLDKGQIKGIMMESGNHSYSFIDGVVSYYDKCCNICFTPEKLDSIVINTDEESFINKLFKKHKIKEPFPNSK